MIHLPEISPYIFKIGGIGPTWYGLMYAIGFLIGYQLLKRWSKDYPDWHEDLVSSVLTYIILGVILGGRIGYVFLYHFDLFWQNPFYLFKITEGGMSFHGGLLGVIIAMWLFGRKNRLPFLSVTDFIAPAVPPGLFFGRIGNFINGELWGHATDMPWAVVFPQDPQQLPRHPSQLYESILEGLVLFVVVYLFARTKPAIGRVSGLFLIGYSLARFAVEFVRLPDAHIGYMAFGWLTRGQLLTLPMMFFGAYLLLRKVPR
ncbi:MAG: prolipoprotein diacylglyceryl transferase [Gammaproteobacteria bacterium]|nr:MAG: prolipoprotein diacylglyceryl transferase [Gammaproteobacteria bacterium]